MLRPEALCLWLWALPAAAATPPGDFADLSLEEMLDTPVSVASRTPVPLREAPGVLTVITRREIVEMGARDLLDVLRRVPGFQLGVDVEGALGPGFRGLWGTEGKILFRLDGQELNERLYGTTQLGQQIPVEQIERIEIVRGPGSVMYGGFAELAVVDIWTRGAAEVQGLEATASASGTDATWGFVRGGLLVGGDATDDLSLSLGLGGGRGRRSTGTYTDFAGRSVDLTDESALDPRYANLGATWRDLHLRLLFNDSSHETRAGYGDVLPRTDRLGFRAWHAELGWRHRFEGHLELDAHVGWKRQSPWRSDDKDLETYYEKTAEQYRAAVGLGLRPLETLQLRLGLEGFQDRARLDDPFLGGTQELFDGREEIAVEDATALAELRFTPPLVTVVLGGRYEWNSGFGGSFVPRVVISRNFGDAFAKILFSRAFRSPSLENIGLNPSIDPEKTIVLEAELGWQWPRCYVVTLNLFDVSIDQPIVFRYDPVSDTENYDNFRRTGSRGLSLVQRFMWDHGRVDLAWSWYTAEGRNEVPNYAVEGHEEPLLGLAQHQVTAQGVLELGWGASLAPSAQLYGERWGYLHGDADGEPVLGREPAIWVFDLWARFERLYVPGLVLGMGVFDALDGGFRYLQPHASGHAPLPGTARELVVKLDYALAL